MDSYHEEIYEYGTDVLYISSDGAEYVFEENGNAYSCDELLDADLEKTSTGYQISYQNGEIKLFNKYGQLIKKTALTGESIENTYDTLGRLVKLSAKGRGSEAPKEISFVYPSVGNSDLVTTINAPGRSAIQFAYQNSNLVDVTIGTYEFEYGYSNDNILNTICDGEGNECSISYNSNGRVIEIENPLRESFSITYASGKTIVTEYDEDSNEIAESSVEFITSDGRATKETGTDGKEEVLAYCGGAKKYLVASRTTPFGYETMTGSDIDIVNTTGTTSYTYDEKGNILTESEPSGDEWTFVYDGHGNVTSEVCENGDEIIEEWTYEYDSSGRQILECDEISGEKTETTYIGNEKTERAYELLDDGTYAILETIKTTSDSYGMELIYKRCDGNQETTATFSRYSEYDNAGRVTKETTKTDVIEYAYDAKDNVTCKTTTNLDIGTTAEYYSYDGNGKLVQNSAGDLLYTYEYDEAGKNIAITENANSQNPLETEKEYSVVASLVTPSGRTYSNVHLTTTTVTGSNPTFSYVDQSGNEVLSIDAAGVKREVIYDDSCNDAVRLTAAAGDSSDIMDVEVVVQDERGNELANVNNAELTSNGEICISQDSEIKSCTYDQYGNISTETDAEGNEAQMDYDEKERLVSYCKGGSQKNIEYTDTAIEQNGGVETIITSEIVAATGGSEGNRNSSNVDIEYSCGEETLVNEKLVNVMDGRSDGGDGTIHTSYVYDEQGNITRENYSDESYVEYIYNRSNLVTNKYYHIDENTIEEEIQYSYDVYGRVTQVTTIIGDETICNKEYQYDNVGNVICITISYEGGEEKETNYTYDAQGRVVEINYGDSNSIAYEYNLKGQLVAVCVNDITMREYTYDEFGRVASIKDYDSITDGTLLDNRPSTLKSYEYDDNGRISEVNYERGDEEYETRAYTYDKNGNIISKTRVSSFDENNEINESYVYTYDVNGQLIESTKTVGNTTTTIEYEYDIAGNMLSETTTVNNAASGEKEWTYNGLNQMITKTDGEEGRHYEYDENGNLIRELYEDYEEEIPIEYEYTVSGHLSEVRRINGNTVTILQKNYYDENGVRIKKETGITNDNASEHTYYYYNNGDLLFTEDESLNQINYISGTSSDIFAALIGSEYYVNICDINGSVDTILNEGTVAAAYEYGDFGETEKDSSYTQTVGNEICYAGMVYDEETGKYYANARYYDPADCRFITQDTYRGENNDPATWNLYVYCANNPVNYTDPSGHKRIKTFLGAKTISKKMHYRRNKNHKNQKKNLPKTAEEAVKQGYNKMLYIGSLCHQFGKKLGKWNKKYVRRSGHEVVYDYTGKVIDDSSENRGTYNFGSVDKYEKNKITLSWMFSRG